MLTLSNARTILLVGPPGTGKTLWARNHACSNRLSVTYVKSGADADATLLYRLSGLGSATRGPSRPSSRHPPIPFRAPHHTCSVAALVGRMQRQWFAQPGELSLAHGGVLFLDDACEFSRTALEAVEHAHKAGVVEQWWKTGAASTRAVLPARFTLVLAANPCPCGYHGDKRRPAPECRCTQEQRMAYAKRLPESWRNEALHLGPEQYKEGV